MHEVVVDMIGPQAFELFVEEAIEVLVALARSMGKLGRNVDVIAQAELLEYSANACFVARIEVRRV